jgi:Dolichyl-phosphate-mannose-protein mannosyltransferase
MRQRARALGCFAGAALCFSAFRVGAAWSDGYLMRYGSFAPSRGELAFKLHLLLFILPALLLMAVALADLLPESLGRGFDRAGQGRTRRVYPLALALLVLVLVLGIRVWVLRATPITDDENVYHFQARLLASGQLYRESLPEPVRPFFDNQFIVNNGRWYGLYFIGHSLLLAAASRLGATELVGPVQAAVALLLAIGIARRIFGERTAWLSGALLAFSPFFLFVSATHLSQPTSNLCLMCVIYAALRVEASPRAVGWWALGATALAFGVLTRPQSAVLLSLPFLARLGWLFARGRLRSGWVAPTVALAILTLGAAIVLGANSILTGSAFKSGYHAYLEQGHQWLFPFGPVYTVREISTNLGQMNFWLLGWPVSLAFVPFFKRDGSAWALAAVPAVAFLWYGVMAVPSVAAVGPVYYTETIAPLIILSASGFEQLVLFVRNRIGDAWLTRALIAVPVAGFVACFLAFGPVEVASLRRMADTARAPYDLVEAQGLDRALVFVHSLPALHTVPGAWVYYHRNPKPDLSDPVLFVRWLGPKNNEQLMRHFPDRAPYAMGMRDGKLTLVPIQRGAGAAGSGS